MTGRACLVLATLALVAAGCSPGSTPESNSAFDTVVTVFVPNADFVGATTFTVPDTVMHLVEEGGTDNITRTYDSLILARVRADLNALGWTEIPSPGPGSEPDVAVQVGVTTSEYTAIAYWPPYWGYYPGWGYPGYGWGWGGYYTAYDFTTGTVLMAMLDLRHPDPATQTVPVIWLGSVNGVAGSTTSNQTRIVNGIDQAFEQSPYLRK